MGALGIVSGVLQAIGARVQPVPSWPCRRGRAVVASHQRLAAFQPNPAL